MHFEGLAKCLEHYDRKSINISFLYQIELEKCDSLFPRSYFIFWIYYFKLESSFSLLDSEHFSTSYPTSYPTC